MVLWLLTPALQPTARKQMHTVYKGKTQQPHVDFLTGLLHQNEFIRNVGFSKDQRLSYANILVTDLLKLTEM